VKLAASLIFAAFQSEGVTTRLCVEGAVMSGNLSFLTDVDRLCGEFAAALHNTEWQTYATLTLLILLSALLFPPKDDPDQV
jgi:hypothetical protein